MSFTSPSPPSKSASPASKVNCDTDDSPSRHWKTMDVIPSPSETPPAYSRPTIVGGWKVG